MRQLTLAGATLNQTPFDWKNNCTNIYNAIEAARRQRVELLCLPELCLTGYSCEDAFLSEWLSAAAWEKLLELCPHTQGIAVSVGLPIRIDGRTYNGAALLHNGKILGINLKQNLPKDGIHYEPRWFEEWKANEVMQLVRGDQRVSVGDLVYEINGVKIGFEICEDAWVLADRPGERLHQRGIDVILNPSASHFAMSKSAVREELIRKSSEQFECAYVYVNQLGNEAGRILYDGDIIIAQRGTLTGLNRRLSFKPFDLLVCSVDLENPTRTTASLEQDLPSKNEELAQAIALGLFDYLRKSKARGFVLSLSGGADSSCIATLVSEMVRRGVAELGADAFCQALGLAVEADTRVLTGQLLTCAYQGTKNSSKETYEAARELAESIGAEFHTWEIDEEVNSYTRKAETAIGRPLRWETDDVTLQNIQARSRSPIIWMLANIKRSLLLTTSNRSEGDVGYATMDGDTSGSLAPIAGLSKPFVIQWLTWAEKELAYPGLRFVNGLQPTAELRPRERHQTDEADLMPYSVLEQIELLAIQQRKSPVEVYRALTQGKEDALLKKYVRKFFHLWSINQWKRERIAPSFHVDNHNVDPRSWCRFPILSGGFEEELEGLI